MEEQADSITSPEGSAVEEGKGDPLMQGFLEEDYSYPSPKRGEVVEGTVVSVSPEEILIDVGCKTEGVVSSRDLERMDAEVLQGIHEGDRIFAYVVRPEDQEGNLVLSLTRAEMERDWRRAEQLFEADKVFQAVVSSFNKGGAIARIGKVRGFVPRSQLIRTRPLSRPTDTGDEDPLAQLVGQTLNLKVIELDRRRNRLILSEKAAVREERRLQKEKLLAELREGELRRGVVSSLCSFGAFVDLGGADGLVHLSELSWGHVNHPSEVLNVGDEVDVHVLNVDRERRRIALSIKRTQPEPWSQVEELYHVDQLVDGRVTKITDFGAFARLPSNIEGLIHVSELSEEHVNHPSEVVREGATYTLRIIRIDCDRHRIGLSLKRVEVPQEEERQPDEGEEPDQETVLVSTLAEVDAEEVAEEVTDEEI